MESRRRRGANLVVLLPSYSIATSNEGNTTRSKKLLVAPGITTSNKDATRSNKGLLLGAYLIGDATKTCEEGSEPSVFALEGQNDKS